MNISKKDQYLLLGMLLVVVVFVFMRFVYMPSRTEIQTLKATQQDLQKEKKQLEKVIPKTNTARQENEQKYANLNKRLPSEDELVPLLTVLDDSCRKYKLPMTSLEYRGAKEQTVEVAQSDAQVLVFTVGTKGKVSQLFDYLNSLENEQRLISVLDVTLNAVKAEKSTTTVDENQPPAYYIAPPGMPEAKLQRVKFEVVDEEETANGEQPVAVCLVPDTYEMKITINAFYAADAAMIQPNKTKTENNIKQDNTNGKAKGEV